ncbi:MAG: hypothetical protein OXT65_06850 [Alphaproteobacteria bacterium]|nr:hypothetical protein [Alphaproteobacteria bacterium]
MAEEQKDQVILPKTPAQLAEMGEDLNAYLRTIESNTDNVNSWLETNRTTIAKTYHRLTIPPTAPRHDSAR